MAGLPSFRFSYPYYARCTYSISSPASLFESSRAALR